MDSFKKIAAAASIVILTGCASGLNSIQDREYAAWKNDGVLVVEKDPALGVALGFLPGGGSFYAREPGYGILNLLLWPASILWDPISGLEGAKVINYDVTKSSLKRAKNEELTRLEDELTLGNIDSTEYVLKKRSIDQKYSYD
ncbi:hypothetical protein [Zhongshania sp.]|jgi:hypothetical protein|uniref:hypothetical protein n=1 Tax=Zhongshania sp. TaxID=1971902 RepID=UPI002A806943|nr:hypothetical protein [Zhongshania sp.]